MKILQLSPYSMSRPGGVQTHIRSLSTWLENHGHEVRIIAPPGDTDLSNLKTMGQCRSITMHGTGFEITRAKRTELRHCVEELRHWGADIAHLHTPWTPMLPWQIWRKLGVPGVATFHATLPKSHRFDPMTWALQRSAHYYNRRLKGVVVPSDSALAQWKAISAAPLPRVLPPAIDLSAWRAAKEITPKSDGFDVVYLGRLEERKGVAVLLQAWSEIQAARPDAKLTIAGSGTEEPHLRQMVQDLALSGVAFRPAPTDAEAPALVAQADILAAPALHGESFGLILIEAMAAGTLPVAAANSGFSTVMTGPGTELLVPPGDTAALARKLLDLATHPAKMTRLRRWAKGHAEVYDVRTLGAVYERWFKKALQ